MFDRQTVKNTRNELQAILETLSKEMGCQIKVAGAMFARDGSNCTFKVEFAAISADGTAETKEVTAFRELAAIYGLRPDDFGKTCVSGGQEFTISGLKPKAKRYPILATRPDGKVYKFSEDMVRIALTAAAEGDAKNHPIASRGRSFRAAFGVAIGGRYCG